MCSGQEWPPEARELVSGAKRRAREIQQLQVASVCLGIQHLMSKRRRVTTGAAGGAARVPQPGQHTRLCHDNGGTARGPHPSHRRRGAPPCRLCDSTLRVLSIARAHGKRCRRQQRRYRNHMHIMSDNRTTTTVSSCEACRIWSLVGDRCASLGISLPGDMFVPVGGGGLLEIGVAAPAPATVAAVSALPDAGPVVRVNTASNE